MSFFFKQKTTYEILACLGFRRVLFRSAAGDVRQARRPDGPAPAGHRRAVPAAPGRGGGRGVRPPVLRLLPAGDRKSVGEGKSVDLGGRRNIKKKKNRPPICSL